MDENRDSGIDRRSAIGLLSALGLGLVATPLRQAQAFQAAGENTVAIQRLNWAGLKIETGNSVLYIDAVRPDESSGIDASSDRRSKYAAITHVHGDHYDPEFLLETMGARGVLFHYRDAILEPGPLRTNPLAMWEPGFIPRSGGDMVIFPVPASDGFGDTQVSWVVDAGGKRIVHCGDTLWHGRFWDIGRAFGPFDWAFLPINGAQQAVGRFEQLGVPGVMTPEQAVAAAQAMRARTIVPIHYGSADPPHYIETEDAEGRLRRAAEAQGIAVSMVAPGSVLSS